MFVCSFPPAPLIVFLVALKKCAIYLLEPLDNHRPRSEMAWKSWGIRGAEGVLSYKKTSVFLIQDEKRPIFIKGNERFKGKFSKNINQTCYGFSETKKFSASIRTWTLRIVTQNAPILMKTKWPVLEIVMLSLHSSSRLASDSTQRSRSSAGRS